MNKQEFLQELQTRIRILEDSEQQDILAEYSQHIDLRMSHGLSEEEAIRDFGDIGQLACEILEAYHVKPDGTISHEPAPPLFSRVRKAFKKAGRAAGSFFARLWRAISRFFRSIGRRISHLFRRRTPDPASAERQPVHRPPALPRIHMPRPARRRDFSGFKRAFRTLGHALALFFTALARLLWNAVILALALPFVVMGVFSLLGIGVLITLLVQGYPLVGASLCLLGILLCSVSVLGLCRSGRVRMGKPKREAEAPDDPMPMEQSADLSV